MRTDRTALGERLLPPLLLAAAAALAFFFRLGERGFENKDTVWYVEIAWEMLRSGDWIVPRFNGVIFTEKPVLFIWLVAASAKLLGGITPLASRLPSALAATGCAGLTLAMGKRLFGRRAAYLAAFVLCTNYAFAWEARVCMVDMTFTFFVTLTMFLLYLGAEGNGERARPFLLAYAASGLAALTKGPLGLGFPAIAFLAYLAWTRRLSLLARARLPWGVIIVAAIQAAWYVPYLVRIGPAGREFFWEMYVLKENLLRLATGFDKPEPFWFYAPAIFAHFLPWSVVLVLYPFFPRAAGGGGAARDRAFPAAWFIAVFVFLTASAGKHSRYALPLYPAAALLVGEAWDQMISCGECRMGRAIAAVVAALAAAGAAGLPVFARFAAPPIFASSLILSAVLLCAAAALLRARPAEKPAASFAAVAVSFVCFWAVFIASLPAHDARRAEHRRLAESVAPAVRDGRLATYGLFSRRLALGFFMGRTVSYLDREAQLSDHLRPGGRSYCLMEAAEYEKLRGTLPPHAAEPGAYRYRKLDLVLISNR